MEKIAVVEAGPIGRAWAILFARAGFEVGLRDSSPDPSKTLGIIEKRLEELHSYGQLQDDVKRAFQRISLAPSLEAALEGAFHVQENGEDTRDAKVRIFERLDKLAAPHVVLASSTSAVLPTEFTESLAGRGRCLVVHPVQPPFAVSAVEIVPGKWTEVEVVSGTRSLMERCRLVPIMIQREVLGYVINNLQTALACEAFRLVDEGIATAEDCEAVVKYGLGLRWSLMGPFESGGVNATGGIAEYFTKQSDFLTKMRAAQSPVHLTAELINGVAKSVTLPGGAEQRREWRDRRLMALAKHASGQPK